MMLFFVPIVVWLAVPMFFPTRYGSELIVSFLPYLIVISSIALIRSFAYIKKTITLLSRYLWWVVFLCLGFLFFWYSKQFTNFYAPHTFTGTTQSWLTVLFANIHKNNTQYSAITWLISRYDPDMLMFVEFADHHYTHLKDFLKTHYPYTNSTTRSKTFVGSMVFSKYPLTNKADDFPQWMWRYGYFSLPYQWQQRYFYLVHTSSPDTYNHFLMRNEQLTTFVQNFDAHKVERKHDNIVVVWDFNITPWSAYYPLLTHSFSGQLINITQQLPLLFTRKFASLPLFYAHIDHLRASPSFHVSSFSSFTFPWSDHNAFLFTLSL